MNSAALALKTLRKFWDTTTVPVDPVRIAIQMKIKVIADPLLKDSGFYNPKNDDGIPEIYYNTSESLLRQRFTVAHEIGHHVMGHGSSPREITENFTMSQLLPKERDANIFAMHLLMPADAIQTAISIKRIDKIKQLAIGFCVSRLAMSMRLKELGYDIR